MSGERYGQAELAELRHHWGSAYLFRHRDGGPYYAERRDNGKILTAVSYEDMRVKVAADYSANPVSRDL